MNRIFSALLITILLAIVATGLCSCGGSKQTTPTGGGQTTPNPPQPPTPTPTATYSFASLRADGFGVGDAIAMTRYERQAFRRAAKVAHPTTVRAAADPGLVNIYLWPVTYENNGVIFGNERKVTNSSGAYTSVYLSPNRNSIVFSAVVNGYNQIFTSPVPADGQMISSPLQLTTDQEQHWLPEDNGGGVIVFTKPDPNSSGDLLCFVNSNAPSVEGCIDPSNTAPVLTGAYIWHPSWMGDETVMFEAWGGSLASDEIFIMDTLLREPLPITNNAGTNNYDECPSMSQRDPTRIAVDTWNDTTQQYDINVINLTGATGNQRIHVTEPWALRGDSVDPLYGFDGLFWVSQLETDQSIELYDNNLALERFTNNIYADYFAGTLY